MVHHNRSTKRLSRQAARPSLRIAICAFLSASVSAIHVNQADASDRRNTVFVDLWQALVKRPGRVFEVSVFTGPAIALSRRDAARVGVISDEIRAFREGLA
jgi:hypothetical protein